MPLFGPVIASPMLVRFTRDTSCDCCSGLLPSQLCCGKCVACCRTVPYQTAMLKMKGPQAQCSSSSQPQQLVLLLQPIP